MNDNQNAFVKRSTSRVLGPPGGASSMGFLFGGAPPAAAATNKAKVAKVSPKSVAVDTHGGEDSPAAAAERTKQRLTAGSGIFPSASPPTQATKEPAEVESPRKAAERIRQKQMQGSSVFGAPPAASRPPSGAVSSNAFASAATTNSYNVMTGRPSSRVLAPPGGKSQIRLG
ncbi:hypothetical protein THAOC_32411 [Thalassiosira oceanica]|uniref:DUF4057 domain-containing protein n=1 Tax=Thalassiosira oceanica TaxID=159749 RepID=K0R634_THAOC|nr:hypothetical protein THAOC_32411 [Thalassiosira oceanica]|mmetsp:Transcript_9682/g.22238  ORF Transcript_9682/g.22238 Transcript_9682/m.22238 type:complete len:172 (+) Transcript_9682:59-574(+)|eukprot:EJK48763.1 hypothetical protein THAOC_32411 [Thalassiosira oceanica]